MILTIYGEPAGKGRPRFSTKSGRAYTPAKTSYCEANIQQAYILEYNKPQPIEKGVPVRVDLYAYFKIPDSASKKKANANAKRSAITDKETRHG